MLAAADMPESLGLPLRTADDGRLNGAPPPGQLQLDPGDTRKLRTADGEHVSPRRRRADDAFVGAAGGGSSGSESGGTSSVFGAGGGGGGSGPTPTLNLGAAALGPTPRPGERTESPRRLALPRLDEQNNAFSSPKKMRHDKFVESMPLKSLPSFEHGQFTCVAACHCPPAYSTMAPVASRPRGTCCHFLRFLSHAWECAVASRRPRATESPRRPEMPTILEEEFDDSWFGVARQVERAFERSCYRVPNKATGTGGLVYCYEIRWADGSSRRMYGYPCR